ncbi:MAG: hypothetical protein ACYC0X_06365 [Pirellulaceae bacterium]
MSLFENEEYRWRDTYFVLFHSKNRPTADATLQALEALGPRFRVQETGCDEEGRFESLTLVSPDDFSAMDISFIVGDEVEEQVATLIQGGRPSQLNKEEQQKWKLLPGCDARFDIYHFERIVLSEEDDEEEGFLDPGGLLIVLECLAKLCHGVSIDPQAGTVL